MREMKTHFSNQNVLDLYEMYERFVKTFIWFLINLIY